MQLSVSQIAERIGAKLLGDGSGKINTVSTAEAAGSSNITFAKDRKHAKSAADGDVGAVIVSEPIADLNKPQLVVKNVDAALIEVLKIFAPKLRPVKPGIDQRALVADSDGIGKGVSIGPYVVVESGARIGDDSIISSGCKIGQNTKIGKNCRLDSNVVVEHNCVIGNDVIIQANSVIGSTGFGYSYIDGAHRLIPHNGGVVIEDFVEIGACCCVDRAKFGNTFIGAGTKMDNLIQIGHNAVIGKCCVIVAQVAMGGSSEIGDGVVLAGHAGVSENVKVGAGAIVAAKSGVTSNIEAGKKVFGMPARDHIETLRILGLTRRLPEMLKRLKQLSSKVEKLEAAKNNSQ